LKILHVITTIERGGAENQLLILVTEQIKINHQVSVMYLKGHPDLAETFLHLGVSLIDATQSTSIWSQMKFVRKTFFGNFDIVHCHLPRAELLTAVLNFRIPFLVSRHNSEQFFPKATSFVSSTFSRYVTFRSKAVIAITHAVAEYLKINNEIASKREVDVIYYGYPNRNQPKSKDSFSGIIGTVSRLVPQKDLVTLIRAFSTLRDDDKDLTLRIYGEGSEESALKKLVYELALNDCVEFCGKVEDVAGAMQEMDIFVLTSLYEGFGLVLLEAMYNQVPIIASNSKAALEVLTSEYPLFFKIGDQYELSQKIQLVLSMGPTEYREFGNKRLKDFDPEKMSSRIGAVYDRICSASK
jgi:glycosyltransferase involved in cell wall biosynthesis